MVKELKNAFLVFVAMTLLTGALYPLLITVVAQIAMPYQANGSILRVGGKAVGSELIGQSFDDPKYFWSRLSATTPAYNAGASSGSNYGPLNPALKDAVVARIKALKEADPSNNGSVPVDLVTASGSGLDPHISLAAAQYQASRVAHSRGLTVDAVKEFVKACTEGDATGLVGQPAVNVLKLNLALDSGKLPQKPSTSLPEIMKWSDLQKSPSK